MSGLRKKLVKIKTMTNNMNGKLTPHKACIGVASLELEKQRHMQELTSLLQRVAELNTRLEEITKEQARLTKLFLEENNTSETDVLALVKKDRQKSGPEINSGIFKIKY